MKDLRKTTRSALVSLRSGKACETEKGWVGRMGGGEAMTRVSGKSLNPNDGLRVGRHVFRKKKKKRKGRCITGLQEAQESVGVDKGTSGGEGRQTGRWE